MSRERKARRKKSRSVEPVASATTEVTVQPDASIEGEIVHRTMRLPDTEANLHRTVLRRAATWLAVILVAAAILIPLTGWLRYYNQHVTSNNATVRAHLAEIGSRQTGLVTEVRVEAGDRVRAGDLLVSLEDGHLRADVQEVRAELVGLELEIDVERMAIKHERLRTRQQEEEAQAKVSAAGAQTTAAKVRVEDARRVHDVRKSLFSRGGAITGEDVRNAESDRRKAEAFLAEAEANYIGARSSNDRARLTLDGLAIRESRVSILESDVMRAQARLRGALERLEAASIRAPEDGAIVRRFVQPGGTVEVGQPIIAMWLGREVWVEAWIDEDDISAVRIGADVTLNLHAFPDLGLTGVVDKIGLVTDFELPETEVPQPRYSRMRGAPVVGVKVKLLDPPDALLPGLSAVVAIKKSPG